jgi:hypothetical protein
MKWNMVRKKMSDIQPAGYNPREIRPEAITGLTGSIARFGMLEPIIWNKRSGNIVGGHQRFKVLSTQGVEETDVVVLDLDDNEEVALNITLNNPSVRGVFTKSVVKLLEQSQASMADEFQKVGLDDMLNYLKRYKFDAPEEKGEGKGSSGSKGTSTGGRVKDGMMCPRCRSIWNKSNGEVVRRTGVANG